MQANFHIKGCDSNIEVKSSNFKSLQMLQLFKLESQPLNIPYTTFWSTHMEQIADKIRDKLDKLFLFLMFFYMLLEQ